MRQEDVVVAVFATHDEADAAAKKLAADGFAPKHTVATTREPAPV